MGLFELLTDPINDEKFIIGFQSFIYDITQHLYFKRAIAVLVLINSFLLCVKWEEDIDNDDDEAKNSTQNATFEETYYNDTSDQVFPINTNLPKKSCRRHRPIAAIIIKRELEGLGSTDAMLLLKDVNLLIIKFGFLYPWGLSILKTYSDSLFRRMNSNR